METLADSNFNLSQNQTWDYQDLIYTFVDEYDSLSHQKHQYQSFQKRISMQATPDYIFHKIRKIDFPTKLKNLITRAETLKEKFVFDLLTELNMYIFFFKNQLCIFKYSLQDSQNNFVISKEMPLKILNVSLARVQGDMKIFLVYFENSSVQFYAIKNREILKSNVEINSLKFQKSFYSKHFNNLFLINEFNLKYIEIDVYKESYKLHSVFSPILDLKKIKDKTVYSCQKFISQNN